MIQTTRNQERKYEMEFIEEEGLFTIRVNSYSNNSLHSFSSSVFFYLGWFLLAISVLSFSLSPLHFIVVCMSFTLLCCIYCYYFKKSFPSSPPSKYFLSITEPILLQINKELQFEFKNEKELFFALESNYNSRDSPPITCLFFFLQ